MQPINITDAFRRGLAPDSRMEANYPYLSSLYGAIPTPFGLRPMDTVQALVPGLSPSHPFPQLFRGRSVCILADETALYTVNENTGVATGITTYDFYNPASTKGIVPGGTWEFADFYTSWYMSNGECFVFKTKWKDENKVFVVSDPKISNVCAFRGRLVHGGYSGSFWNATWQAFWATLCAQGFTTYGFTLGAPGQNWVGWSSIGGGDTLHFLDSDLAKEGISGTGEHNSSWPLFVDMARRNESAFMPVGWAGSCKALFPARTGIYVATDSGLSFLQPFSSPVPSFGLVELVPCGAAGRGAIGGEPGTVLYVDSTGALWVADSSPMPTRLGYESSLESLVGSDITISYNAKRQSFFIAGSDRCFIFSRDGLAEVDEIVHSSFILGGELYGVSESKGAQFSLETLPMDFGSRKTKLLQAVEIGTRDTSAYSLTVSYRDSVEDDWTDCRATTLDKRGRALVGVEAVEYKFALESSSIEPKLDTFIVEIEERKTGVGARG